ncbi:hypothetical protein FJT64_010274 [Amphibalanus amphitrite]|uniref:Uncharacterized protein n=1 Tax=Amphibalanus amphitrite TaxID=1232801 RepID=A0A6A4VK03_AMPAM|nr:hypothetical protein FJT64_010274 [Amphibalanus amphitrite]
MEDAHREWLWRTAGRLGRTALLLGLVACTWWPALVGCLSCLSIALPLKWLHELWLSSRSALAGPYHMTRTVLVSGGHRPQGLHVARALRKEGFRVVVVSPRSCLATLAFYSTCVDRVIQVPCPRTAPQHYARELHRIAIDYRVDFFLPMPAPKEVEAESAAASQLSRIGVSCLCVPLPHVADFVRLDRFYELVESMNMETVMYYKVRDMARVAGLYRRGVIVINGCRFMAKTAAPNGLHESKWLPMPRSLSEAQQKYDGVIGDASGSTWVVAKFTAGYQYLLTVVVRKNRVLASVACREGRTLHMVRSREMEQWAVQFFRRLPREVSGAFTFRFLKTVPEGRRTTYLPVFCKPCADLSMLFVDGRMGVLSALLADGVQPPAVDVFSEPRRPLCVYSGYAQLMRLAELLPQPRQLLAELARSVKLLLRGREAVFSLCDPLPFLLWNHVLLPWRLVRGLLCGGRTVDQFDFLSGQFRDAGEWFAGLEEEQRL